MAKSGRIDEAIGQFAAALRIRPDLVDARQNLGMAIAIRKQGQPNRRSPSNRRSVRAAPSRNRRREPITPPPWDPKSNESRIKTIHSVLAVCGLLAVAVVIVFGQTIRHDFVNYDDQAYVYDNPQVAQGLTAETVNWSLTAYCGGNWHPLTLLSHALDCQLYGTQRAAGHHLTNVALHAAVVILLFLILWQMTGNLWPSAFVAAVFAVHPLRVESVAWIAERKDVLSGLFFMLTLAAYLNYVRQPFSRRYLLVAVLFALGLMAKPMLVTLPFVLLLLDYWPLGRLAAATEPAASWQRPWHRLRIHAWRWSPKRSRLLLLTAASCVATSLAHGRHGRPGLPLSLRIGNALVAYVAYIGQVLLSERIGGALSLSV